MSVRRRPGGSTLVNGVIEDGEKVKDPEFALRESPLTVLIEHSLHIRAIYHIFVVILLILLCDTMVYDLVERGKINIGFTTVVNGFRGFGESAKLWLFELLVALSLLPGLHLYSWGLKFIKDNKALCKLWMALGVIGVVSFEVILIGVTIWQLLSNYHALASTVAVGCEMFRFAMKILAVAAACAPRCHDHSKPVPSLSHHIYFLFAPTLIYRDHYPRTKNIRWSVVVLHLLEVTAIVFYNSFLFERFILPYWSDYGKEPQVEAGTVVRSMFACVLPGVISFLCGFYCVLHAWLNAFAEMLRFGDRLFYEEWWTTSQFSRYYKAWNRVVHSWIRDHLYRPLAPYAGRALATFLVFIISAIVHEIILALSFGFFYPVLMFEFGVFGVLLLPLTATSGRKFPSILNLLMWFLFFIGNGIIWSLYPMEYFARQNCPPSEHDSFFVPKSWSCPEIVLKPNWKFQNPFEMIN